MHTHTHTHTWAGTYYKGFTDPASISDTLAASDALVFVGEARAGHASSAAARPPALA